MFEPKHLSPNNKSFSTNEELQDMQLGQSMAPPALSFTTNSFSSSQDPESDGKDQFITDTAKRELATTADMARFLPKNALQALNGVSHPVKSQFLNPLLNSNLSRQNLELVYMEWDESDPDEDPRKLAMMLAIMYAATYKTMQSVNEKISLEKWANDELKSYADSGYWGRGFVQLTWKESYQKLSDELGLDMTGHPGLSVLPTVAAKVLSTGLFESGFGNDQTLNKYFSPLKADWVGAAKILGNFDSAELAKHAQIIHGDINNYHGQLANGQIAKEMSLTDFLFVKGEAKLFQEGREADAFQVLNTLGHCEKRHIQEPSSKIHAQYLSECQALGQTHSNTQNSLSTAVASFQKSFNRNHKFESVLNEDGEFDEITQQALFASGHQISCGEKMIQFAFEGELNPQNLAISSFQKYKAENLSLAVLGAELLSFMPSQRPAEILGIFNQLPESEARGLANEIASQAKNHNELALINQEILLRIKSELEKEHSMDALARVSTGFSPESKNHLLSNQEQAGRISTVLF